LSVLLLFAQDDQNFLGSYRAALVRAALGDINFEDAELRTVETAVAALVRYRAAGDRNRLCCRDVNNNNYLTVVHVDSDGLVTVVKCTRCHNDTITKDQIFLGSYRAALERAAPHRNFEEEEEEEEEEEDAELRTVETAVAALVRYRVADDRNRLCCHNVNNLTVVHVDSYGFVTVVECIRCHNETITKCHSLTWADEEISNLSKLKKGDHICWHRWWAIWHHAIVTGTNVDNDQNIEIVEYGGNMRIRQININEAEAYKCWCDTLYRVNYHDCYNNEYTVLRARKLVNEDRYNLAERNCEHFSRWCKTGFTTSNQISIAWTTAGKVILTIGLRLLVLVILGLLEYLHESQEDKVRDRAWFELLQKILIVVYTVVVTVLFIVYLLKTSGSHLAAVRRDDAENTWCCRPETDNCCMAIRSICCILCTCCSIIGRIVCYVCDNVKRNPCTFCRRPARLAFGLFMRIVVRELLAAAGTLAIILNEERITKGIRHLPPRDRTALLLFYATLAQLGGYLIGALLGRFSEACCTCCCKFSPSANNEQAHVPI